MQFQNQQSINLHKLEERVRSKKELYEFLTLDCHAYLPKLESTNVYFFKDIIQGKKNYLNRDMIHVAQVPHYEGLTVNDILNFARQNQTILNYLPDENDWLHCDRKLLCDIIYSLEQDRFQTFINQALQLRKEKLEQNQDLLVNILPEFLQALNNTLSFTQKGRSVFLLKNSSHRKRRKYELEEVKEEESLLKQDKQVYMQKNKRLKQELHDKQPKILELENYEKFFYQLNQEGIVDEDGNLRFHLSENSSQIQHFNI